MTVSQNWKVVRRLRFAQAAQLVSRNSLRGSFSGKATLIAGPFASMDKAQRWIDAHPELGPDLAVAPIVLSSLD
jgi:hypothetical protein